MLLLWIVVLVMAFLLLGSLRQIGLLQLRLGDDPGALITRSGLDVVPTHAVDTREIGGRPPSAV